VEKEGEFFLPSLLLPSTLNFLLNQNFLERLTHKQTRRRAKRRAGMGEHFSPCEETLKWDFFRWHGDDDVPDGYGGVWVESMRVEAGWQHYFLVSIPTLKWNEHFTFSI
jgi:hypothetical protein